MTALHLAVTRAATLSNTLQQQSEEAGKVRSDGPEYADLSDSLQHGCVHLLLAAGASTELEDHRKLCEQAAPQKHRVLIDSDDIILLPTRCVQWCTVVSVCLPLGYRMILAVRTCRYSTAHGGGVRQSRGRTSASQIRSGQVIATNFPFALHIFPRHTTSMVMQFGSTWLGRRFFQRGRRKRADASTTG